MMLNNSCEITQNVKRVIIDDFYVYMIKSNIKIDLFASKQAFDSLLIMKKLYIEKAITCNTNHHLQIIIKWHYQST